MSGLENLKDVPRGDELSLDSASFKHASFFNRIRERVRQQWHPDKAFRLNDPDGRKTGEKDRTTELLVVLNADGSLNRLYVERASGADFLDDEAWRAIENAVPFPNVPADLVDSADGLVKFTFVFIVEIGQPPVFRMRRYR